MRTKERRGITLVALVITIVILLILAGVSINMMLGENGIITKAREARIKTAVSSVKEEIGMYSIAKETDGERITPETLLAEGKVGRKVIEGEDGNYYINYYIKSGAFSSMQGLGKGNLKDIFLIDEKLNIKYIASNGEVYGDNDIEEKILKDETVIRFYSSEFAEFIKRISGAPSVDKIQFQWMKNLTNLEINDSSITSIEDLVFFPSLTNLQLNGLTLDNMNGIECLSKLKQLRITSCNIKDYSSCGNLAEMTSFYSYGSVKNYESLVDSISQCGKLKEVTIREAQIKEMKGIEKLQNIESLSLYSNSISKVEGIEKLKELKTFDIAGNPIKTIDDIVNNTNIENLKVYSCRLTSLDGIEKLSNLKVLDASNNDIKDITNLAENTKLTELNLKGNANLQADRANFTKEQLQKIDKIGEILDNGGTINLDTDKLKLFNNYTKLNLNGQKLTTLEALEGMDKIEQLSLLGNQLTFEDEKSRQILASMKNLKYLDVRANKITDMTAINNLENLNTVYADGAENNFDLKDMENYISRTGQVQVNTETLQTIVNCNVNNITKLYISGYSGVTTLPNMEKFIYLKELRITGGTKITNYSILENIPNLEKLEITYANLGGNINIDFSKFGQLKSISLMGNYLSSEDLKKLTCLKENNNLTSIDLRNNSIIDATALLELNSNVKISLSGNINLSQSSKDKMKEKFGNNVSF